MNPLRLDRIEPRALGGQNRHGTIRTPWPLALTSLLWAMNPLSHLMAFVPACVVPDEKQSLLAPMLEPVAAPPKKPCGYGAHRATVHEPQPGLFHLRQIQPVAGESLRLRIVLSRLFLKEAHRRSEERRVGKECRSRWS